MAKVASQRGLKNYIQELRNCTSKESEKERVDKEMGKIRKKYTSDKSLSAYDKRKYMWKLLYTHMLGYDVDFGQKQAMDLLASSGYAEKQVGYVACGVFLNEKDDLLRLVINSVRTDLLSRNEAFQCLALHFIANVGGAEFAQLLTADVMNVLTNGATRPIVRKKAALCLLRLLRKAPPDADLISADEWGPRMATLLEERDLGVLLGITTLLLGIVSRSYEGFEACVPRLVAILDRLKARDVAQDYTYYGLSSPWLQVRILRLLQYFPPPDDPATLTSLTDAMRRILAGNEPIKNPNKSNAVHAIAFEAVAVAVALGNAELSTLGLSLMARFLTVREPNLRYLALENFARLASIPEVIEAVARHQATVLACLHDSDVAIRRRALDLMFTTATTATAPKVVDELLSALPRADFAMREELLLKAAVLAERFPPSHQWYVDSMLRLMQGAGDVSVDDVWHSVVQLVASEPSLQKYAAEKVVQGLREGPVTEPFLRCAAFILGEQGIQLDGVSASDQFKLLHAHFPAAALDTKAMLLTAYEKLRAAASHDAQLVAAVSEVLERHTIATDTELQQRAVEYVQLASRPNAAAVALQTLPPWEKRASLLLRRLAEREGEGEDEARELPAWMAQESSNDAAREDGIAAAGSETGSQQVTVQVVQEPAVAPAVPPPAPVVPDLLDLLDLSDDVPPQAVGSSASGPAGEAVEGLASGASEAPVAIAAAVATAAPKSSSNPFADSPPVAVAPSSPSIKPTGNLSSWFRALCQASSGVLYEDANLQIGIRMTEQGASSQLGLYLGNKSRYPLRRFICAVPPAPALALALGQPPVLLEPGKQVHVPLEATCLTPFSAPPVLQIGYVIGDDSGEQLARTLDLPLVVTKFCQPVEVPEAVFTARWAQVAGEPFKLSARVRAPAASHDGVARVLASLHLCILNDVDPTPGTVCAACVLHCTSPQPRQVPCMVKVQGLGTGGSEVDITVATADAAASDGLRATLVRLVQVP